MVIGNRLSVPNPARRKVFGTELPYLLVGKKPFVLMNKRFTLLKLVAACSLPMLFTGCASYMVGSTQKVPLRSTPPGAVVTVYNNFSDTVFEGTTPCTVDLRRCDDQRNAGYYRVVFSHDGYAPNEVVL